MVIAKRDLEGVWHLTDPTGLGCDWQPPDDHDPAIEAGTLDLVEASVDGARCDDCDW